VSARSNATTYVLFVCCCLASGSALADSPPRYPLRNSINLPDDCAFDAHEPGYETLSDICAKTLLAIDALLKKFWLRETCQDDVVPDLSVAAVGESMDDRLGFLALGQGRFLIEVLCIEGAYNVGFHMFAYDEATKIPVILDEKASQPLAPLVIFPMLHAPEAPNGFSYMVNARDFDDRRAVLYHLDKMIGDGSGGDYAEYGINRKTFIPTLRRSMYKEDADHEDGYNFGRGELPHGKDWHSDDIRSAPPGCLMTLEDNRPPTTEPAVSCHGQRGMVR
jgi:hypothetical protein